MPSRRLSRRSVAAVLTLALTLAGLTGGREVAGADEITDLRDGVPSGDDVRDDLGAIADERRMLIGRLARLEGDVEASLAAREALGEEGRVLAEQIERAEEQVRRIAVRAFVTGNPVGDFRYLLDVGGAADLSWRQELVRDAATTTTAVIDRLGALRAEADLAVIEAVEEADGLRMEIDVVERRLVALDHDEREATELLAIADAWDRAEAAIREGPYGYAPAEKWERLRFCESTHDYAAISPSGAYRGAYQFDFSTWQTVGGSGDPAAAPAAEQDARARELYARRGDQPWPICGHHLK